MADPRACWGEAAGLINWYTEPAVVLDDSAPPFYRWFAGATMNTCFNTLDRHVACGRALGRVRRLRGERARVANRRRRARGSG